MNSRLIILTSGLLLFSVTIVSALFFFGPENAHHKYNSFSRNLPPAPFSATALMDIRYNSFYIAGVTEKTIYLGSMTAPLVLFKLNSSLTDSLRIQLEIEDFDRQHLNRVQVKIDSPLFYIMDGITPALFKGDMLSWKARRYRNDSAYFKAITPISPTSFVLKSQSSSTHEDILIKERMSPPSLLAKYDILEKQIDGSFCVDGMLQYSKYLERVVYLYYYRNQYNVLDTNLNLQYRGRTIDPVDTAQIEVSKVNSANIITLSAPPLVVNKKSCVAGKYLYVNSTLLSKSEIPRFFDHLSVIDVYDLESGKYKFSFYIPEHESRKMDSFAVYKDMVVVLNNHYIMVYKFSPHISNELLRD